MKKNTGLLLMCIGIIIVVNVSLIIRESNNPVSSYPEYWIPIAILIVNSFIMGSLFQEGRPMTLLSVRKHEVVKVLFSTFKADYTCALIETESGEIRYLKLFEKINLTSGFLYRYDGKSLVSIIEKMS